MLEHTEPLAVSEEQKSHIEKQVDSQLVRYARLFGAANLMVVLLAVFYMVATVPRMAAEEATRRTTEQFQLAQQVLKSLATENATVLNKLGFEIAEARATISGLNQQMPKKDDIAALGKRQGELVEQVRRLEHADLTKVDSILKLVNNHPDAKRLLEEFALIKKTQLKVGFEDVEFRTIGAAQEKAEGVFHVVDSSLPRNDPKEFALNSTFGKQVIACWLNVTDRGPSNQGPSYIAHDLQSFDYLEAVATGDPGRVAVKVRTIDSVPRRIKTRVFVVYRDE